MNERIQRVNRLIKRELSQIILKEIDFPRNALVTITRVETSPGLRKSKVFVSTMPENKTKNTMDILNRLIYPLQQQINRRLNMRPVPQISFAEEKETATAGKIEEILEELKKEEK